MKLDMCRKKGTADGGHNGSCHFSLQGAWRLHSVLLTGSLMLRPRICEGQDGQRVESQRKGSWLYCATEKDVWLLSKERRMCGMSKLTQTVDWMAYFSSSAKKDFKEGSLS